MCQHHQLKVLHTYKILTSPLSKSLVQYVALLPEKRTETSTRVTKARVLMSAEGFQILHKKEKRRKEKEEKERKKQESFKKKKERDEVAKIKLKKGQRKL